MEKESNDISEGKAGVPAPGTGASPESEAKAASVEATGQPRRTPSTARRRTPSTAANRRIDKETAAKVEEWRLRQASRAVPPAYRAGTHGQMPASVLTSDDDVLAEQNAIPEDGRPVRTRPSIPNYESRVPVIEPELEAVETDAVIDADVVVDKADDKHSATQSASATLRESAAKAGEAGSALIENIQQSDAAAKAKDFAASVPGVLGAAGKRAVAALHAEDGTLRKKPIAIGAIVILYLIVSIYFSFHYYPMTSIGQVQVGGMDVPQAAQALGEAVDGYALRVEGENDVSFTVMGSEAGLSLDSEDLARKAMDADSGFLWPVMIILPHDHSDVMVASADAGGFRETISDAVSYFNENATAPKDATISYNEQEKRFSIIPEERGNTLDEKKVTEHVIQALASMAPTLTLGEDDYLKPAVYQDDERLATALEDAQKALATNVTYTAHGKDVATLDGATAAKWVMTDENVQVILNEDLVNEWVQDLVEKCNTVGTKRTWTREDGKQCTVTGGVYGWEADWLAVDEALHDAIAKGSTEKIEIPMAQEGAVYEGIGKRDWKAYIDVDLDTQHATYYDDSGKVLWEADFVSGAPDGEHDTPQGVYFINNKESPSTLVGDANATGSPEYRTEVQYWMAWRENDVGFHDAEWQDEFGGSRFEEGFGSHGCINLSVDDVAALYKIADIGTVVVCHGDSTQTVKKSDADEGEEESDSAAESESSEDEDAAHEGASESSSEEGVDGEADEGAAEDAEEW